MKQVKARRVALAIAAFGVVGLGIATALIPFRTFRVEVYQHAQLTGHHTSSLKST